MAYGMCFINGTWGIVEKHHIFGGARRKLSEKYGLTVMLSPEMHRLRPCSAHRDADTAHILHRYGQKKAMVEQGWSVEEFVKIFGRNYLEEGDLEEVLELQRDEKRRNQAVRAADTKVPVKAKSSGFRITVTVEELPF